jgi:hypothetical protein
MRRSPRPAPAARVARSAAGFLVECSAASQRAPTAFRGARRQVVTDNRQPVGAIPNFDARSTSRHPPDLQAQPSGWGDTVHRMTPRRAVLLDECESACRGDADDRFGRGTSARPSLSWPGSCIGRAWARRPAVPRFPLMASALAIACTRKRDRRPARYRFALPAVADATTSLAIACASMQHSSGRCMLVSRRCEAAALHEPPDDQWTIFQPRWQGSGRCACAPAARRRLDRGARRRDGRGHHVLDGDDRRRARVVDDRLLPPRAPRLDGSRFRLRGGVRPDAEPGGRRARSVGV